MAWPWASLGRGGAQSAELSTAAGFSGSGLGAYQQGGHATARLEVAERVDTPKTKSDKEQSQWGAARRELRCTVSRLQVHRVQTGRQVCRGVYFYGLTLVPMGKDAPPMTEVTEQRRLLRLNGRALPMGSVTRTRTAYRRVEQRLTVQAATALAKAALEEKRAQELPGATIINACVTVEVTPDTVTAVGMPTPCRCKACKPIEIGHENRRKNLPIWPLFFILEICQITQRILASAPPL